MASAGLGRKNLFVEGTIWVILNDFQPLKDTHEYFQFGNSGGLR